MTQKDYLKLLNNITEDNEFESSEHDRVLLIDGLNLFFRNFAMMNFINEAGVHIGGLGGFLRSLGSLINQIQPTAVYVVFDGVGSSTNRKNLLPEYKSGRHTHRITNWEIFDDLDDEHNSKIEQIVRLIHYLRCLPVRTISIDKAEADDIIAYYSKYLPKKYNSKVIIVSSDKDFIQLVDKNVTVFRPMEKTFYQKQTVQDKFNVLAENFILYKTLLGDSSDKIAGIKGLGEKGIFKKFPELTTRDMSFDDLLDVAEAKLKEHVVYARVLHDVPLLEDKHRVMDLSNPMISDTDKMFIDKFVETTHLNFFPEAFVEMCNEDQIGNLIRNTDFWVRDIFKDLLENK